MNLTEFSKEVHKNAIAHGWWEKERTFGNVIVLCHSELSEALEEYRDNKPNAYIIRETSTFPQYESCTKEITDITDWRVNEKPEGIAVELADCIIRILDYCGSKQINIEKLIEPNFNIYKRKQFEIECFEDFLCLCHLCLSYGFVEKAYTELISVVELILGWSEENNIDMYEIIRIKHEYNKTRSYKHGGKKI